MKLRGEVLGEDRLSPKPKFKLENNSRDSRRLYTTYKFESSLFHCVSSDSFTPALLCCFELFSTCCTYTVLHE